MTTQEIKVANDCCISEPLVKIDNVNKMIKVDLAAIDKLKAERDRYKAALESVCEAYGDIAYTVGSGLIPAPRVWENADKILESARVALNPQGKE